MRNETQKEMEEGLKWAKKKLARIEQYEKEGRMPETCSQKLPLEVIAKVYKNILSNPLDEQRELGRDRLISPTNKYKSTP